MGPKSRRFETFVTLVFPWATTTYPSPSSTRPGPPASTGARCAVRSTTGPFPAHIARRPPAAPTPARGGSRSPTSRRRATPSRRSASAPRPARALKPAEAALEIEALRAELAEEHALRLVAEAVAEERSAALKDARLALRAIANAGATPDESRDLDTYEPGPRLPKPRGHWLR